MKIVLSNPEEYKNTGVLARVFPFDLTMKDFSIIVRPGVVDLEGSAFLEPSLARIFSKAILIAADIAEGNYETHRESIVQTNENFSSPRVSHDRD